MGMPVSRANRMSWGRDDLVFLQAVILQFDIIVALAEKVRGT